MKMAAIIIVLAIFGSILLGLISMATYFYHESKDDSEYWELFHDKEANNHE
jgi:hypothetical protein